MVPIASDVILGAEVREALAAGRPVVALESTLISHGLPYPQNIETAREMEACVRREGAVPATVAVLAGELRAGLTDEELQFLATAEGVRKVSRRDMAIAVARRLDGATTVAGTMMVAARAGIRIFATGGIGGVHRGAGYDVSADLPELARTPVAVVCAGAKTILDLPATVEWLETHGVPVLGYRTDEFPAFYHAQSGLPVDQRVDTPAEVAAILAEMWGSGLGAGSLVVVPPPAGAAATPAAIEEAIARAVREGQEQGVRGRDVTPFLLRRVAALTAGASIEVNLALLRQNATVGARIAVALAGS